MSIHKLHTYGDNPEFKFMYDKDESEKVERAITNYVKNFIEKDSIGYYEVMMVEIRFSLFNIPYVHVWTHKTSENYYKDGKDRCFKKHKGTWLEGNPKIYLDSYSRSIEFVLDIKKF